ncbi:MAG: hypothetical protein V6Z89_25590 [Desulfobacter sp.]
MATQQTTSPESGVNFFGKILASATHEIKNNLAIINESAGLLEDLSMMGGASFSPERVNDVAQKIGRQIKRADEILKRMNRFSHSVDVPEQTVDLETATGFVLELGSRLLDVACAHVRIIPAGKQIPVTCNLFHFAHLVWQCVETCLKNSGDDKQMSIRFEDTAQGPAIWFSPDAGHSLSNEIPLDSGQNRDIMKQMNVIFQPYNAQKGFGLLWRNPSSNEHGSLTTITP